MNTHVNFKTAKLLKEKGFDLEVRGRIHVSHWHLVKNNVIPKNVNTHHNDMFAPIGNWNDEKNHFMSIPTIAEVVMWLYEKHGIWVWVSCRQKDNGTEEVIFIANGRNIPIKKKNGFEIDPILYQPRKTPTEAYQETILYTLKKLI